MVNEVQQFIKSVASSVHDGSFVKLKFSKPLNNDSDLKFISITVVEIKSMLHFKFVYSHAKKDITKNFIISEGLLCISQSLGKEFKNYILFTSKKDIHLLYNKKMKPRISYLKPACPSAPNKEHNHVKKRILQIEETHYLRELGIFNAQNEVVPGMKAKWNQINKFIEIVNNTIKDNKKSLQKINVVDMGSGKGYLTFALYDYFVNNLKIDSTIIGIELRKELVDYGNALAQKCGFKNLKFITNTIKDAELQDADLLIALHACNTATDDAICKGITSNCSIIILSPCCHQQIRPELNLTNELKDIGKHGIMKDRLAEMVTDTMRSIMLEAYGYKTQIFEFISDEHTHKNLMIVGIKKETNPNREKYFEKLKKIKSLFGIDTFYLEKILTELG